MKRLWALFALCAALGGAPSLAAAAPAPGVGAVTVTEAPPAALQVGDSFQVSATAPADGGRYLLTLTMLDLETGSSVDLEGWVPTSAGQTVSGAQPSASWAGKAGKAGHYRVYVMAVPLDQPGTVSSSSPSELAVSAAPAPQATPLMTVAVGEPVVVALAIGWVLSRRRRDARNGGEHS
jgi:hypothetical protein